MHTAWFKLEANLDVLYGYLSAPAARTSTNGMADTKYHYVWRRETERPHVLQTVDLVLDLPVIMKKTHSPGPRQDLHCTKANSRPLV